MINGKLSTFLGYGHAFRREQYCMQQTSSTRKRIPFIHTKLDVWLRRQKLFHPMLEYVTAEARAKIRKTYIKLSQPRQ